MAFSMTESARVPFRGWIVGFGAGLSARAEAALDRASRAERIDIYRQLSNAQLARMGLKRDSLIVDILRGTLSH